MYLIDDRSVFFKVLSTKYVQILWRSGTFSKDVWGVFLGEHIDNLFCQISLISSRANSLERCIARLLRLHVDCKPNLMIKFEYHCIYVVANVKTKLGWTHFLKAIWNWVFTLWCLNTSKSSLCWIFQVVHPSGRSFFRSRSSSKLT